MATVYKRKDSPYYWMQYSLNGKLERESTKQTTRRGAEKYCEQRMLEINLSQMQHFSNENMSWEDLKTLVINDYKFRKRKSLDTLLYRIGTLDKHFEGLSASKIGAEILKYIEHRMEKDKVEHSTIERELAVIRRAFSLAKEQKLIWMVPHIPYLESKNVRTGFLKHHEYLDLMKALPLYLQGPVCLAYHSGMRRGEIFNLTWYDQFGNRKIDMIDMVIWLDPPETKNELGRFVPITDELLKHLRVAGKRMKDGLPWVFLNRLGNSKIKDIRYPWKKAVKAIGKPHFLFHDLRRSGLRNLIRSGVPRSVAMKISGHLTEDTFERYNITDDKDIFQAMELQERFLKKQRELFRSKVWDTKDAK